MKPADFAIRALEREALGFTVTHIDGEYLMQACTRAGAFEARGINYETCLNLLLERVRAAVAT